MPATGLDAGQGGGNQRQGDAPRLLLAQQVLGIVEFEGQAEDRGHRRQGDIALAPVETDAEDLFAVEGVPADHAAILHGGGIGAGFGAGQGETGQFSAIGQAGQPIVALRVGAEHHQQFARAERIGHHDGHRGHQRA